MRAAARLARSGAGVPGAAPQVQPGQPGHGRVAVGDRSRPTRARKAPARAALVTRAAAPGRWRRGPAPARAGPSTPCSASRTSARTAASASVRRPRPLAARRPATAPGRGRRGRPPRGGGWRRGATPGARWPRRPALVGRGRALPGAAAPGERRLEQPDDVPVAVLGAAGRPGATLSRRRSSVSTEPREVLTSRPGGRNAPGPGPPRWRTARAGRRSRRPAGGTTTTWTCSGGDDLGPVGQHPAQVVAQPERDPRGGAPRSGSRTAATNSGQSQVRPFWTFCCHIELIARGRSRTVTTTWTSAGARSRTTRRHCAGVACTSSSSDSSAATPGQPRTCSASADQLPTTAPESSSPRPAGRAGRRPRPAGRERGPAGTSTPADDSRSRLRSSVRCRYDVPVLGRPTCTCTRSTTGPPRPLAPPARSHRPAGRVRTPRAAQAPARRRGPRRRRRRRAPRPPPRAARPGRGSGGSRAAAPPAARRSRGPSGRPAGR